MTKNDYIEVIVSPIMWSDHYNSWMTQGDDIHRGRYNSPTLALATALELRDAAKKDAVTGKQQYSVIIRSHFNEPHLNGYREWRSLNGEVFREIHFCDGDMTTSQVRLDAELVMPNIPI